MYRKLYKHLYQSLGHPSPLIVLEARLVRWLFFLSGNLAPEWVQILANAHRIFNRYDHNRLIAYIRRYEWPRGEAGQAKPAYGLFLIVFAIAAFGILALAGQTGLAIASLAPAVDVVSLDEATLADDLIGLERPETMPDNLALVQAASNDYTISHGLKQHGNDARRVRDCMAKQGPAMTWLDTEGFRLQVCQLPGSDQIGMQVEVQRNGQWKSLTEYIKNRFHSLRDISNWLYRCGAKPVR